MARVIKNSHRLDADFTEDTVGFALESFLTTLSFPRYKYSIEPFSRQEERSLGADARLVSNVKGFIPFYMQFKRPSAYPDGSKSKIILDRKLLDLSISPRALYFELRRKQEHQEDYQHNVLYHLRASLKSEGKGDAAYVCPLFLDRSAYRFHMHLAGLRCWPLFWRVDPWVQRNVEVTTPTRVLNSSLTPVLSEHISIPPHALVTHAKHSYSFTERGQEICFHSPVKVADQAENLLDFLMRIVSGAEREDGFIKPGSAHRELLSLFGPQSSGPMLMPEQLFSREQDGVDTWLNWGRYLKLTYDIEQFALVSWEDNAF